MMKHYKEKAFLLKRESEEKRIRFINRHLSEATRIINPKDQNEILLNQYQSWISELIAMVEDAWFSKDN